MPGYTFKSHQYIANMGLIGKFMKYIASLQIFCLLFGTLRNPFRKLNFKDFFSLIFHPPVESFFPLRGAIRSGFCARNFAHEVDPLAIDGLPVS